MSTSSGHRQSPEHSRPAVVSQLVHAACSPSSLRGLLSGGRLVSRRCRCRHSCACRAGAQGIERARMRRPVTCEMVPSDSTRSPLCLVRPPRPPKQGRSVSNRQSDEQLTHSSGGCTRLASPTSRGEPSTASPRTLVLVAATCAPRASQHGHGNDRLAVSLGWKLKTNHAVPRQNHSNARGAQHEHAFPKPRGAGASSHRCVAWNACMAASNLSSCE